MFEKPCARLAQLGNDLGQPDCSFHRFDLTEEGPDTAEFVMPPMLEQAGGFRRDAPVVGVLDAAPLVHLLTNRVDHGRGFFVFLGLSGESGVIVEQQRGLYRLTFALLRLGNRGDELRSAAPLNDLLSRLTLRVKFPVLRRVTVGRVENRAFKKRLIHGRRVPVN